MKSLSLAFFMILAALPHYSLSVPTYPGEKEHLVDIIDVFILGLRGRIQGQGYDPYIIENANYEWDSPVPGYVSLDSFVRSCVLKKLVVTGLSQLVIDAMDYSYDTQVFTIDFGIPELKIVIEDAVLEVSILNLPTLPSTLSGSVTFLFFDMPSTANIIHDQDTSYISVSDLVVNSNLDSIKPDIHLNISGYELNSYANDFLSVNLYTFIKNNLDTINKYIERSVTQRLDDLLS